MGTLGEKVPRGKGLGVFSGPVAFLVFALASTRNPEHAKIYLMGGIALWIVCWWILEPVPMGVTSLLPLVLLPVCGILSARDTASVYMSSTIFVFFGGFLLSLAMEKTQLHRRLALSLVHLLGGKMHMTILGFALATGFISMWMSNTATTLMMLPVALAVIQDMEKKHGRADTLNYSKSLLLVIAYASSMGGIGTYVGTPTNLIFRETFIRSFPNLHVPSFGQWALLCAPLAIAMLFLLWFLLTKVFFPSSKKIHVSRKLLAEERKRLGIIRRDEKWVAGIFFTTAALWMFREPLDIGTLHIPGWTGVFANPSLIDEGTIAIAMAGLLFLIPRQDQTGIPSRTILDKHALNEIPWSILLLFGGGFALAKGLEVSGVSTVMAEMLRGLRGTSTIVLLAIIALSSIFLSELLSNVSLVQFYLPVLISLSLSLHIEPATPMIAATLGASLAFMLPSGTAPNAIVFGLERLRIIDMMKIGFVLNIVAGLLITATLYWLGPILLN